MISFEFIHLGYLWFLTSVPIFILVHLFVMQYFGERAIAFANVEVIAKVMKKKQKKIKRKFLYNDFFILFRRSIILVLFVLAVSGCILVYTGKTSGFDFVLALDVSSSMGVNDIEPNRLVVAQDAAASFVDELKGRVSVGVVSFASGAYVDNVLSKDFSKIKEGINGLKVSSVGGTAIGDAIVTSVNVLEESKGSKSIVLLTDGRNNAGTGVDSAVEYAISKNVMIHTIGFGTLEGGNFSGFSSSVDEGSLKSIAELTGGSYHKIYSLEELENAYSEVSAVKVGKIRMNLVPLLLVVGFILLFFEWLLLSTIYKVVIG